MTGAQCLVPNLSVRGMNHLCRMALSITNHSFIFLLRFSLSVLPHILESKRRIFFLKKKKKLCFDTRELDVRAPQIAWPWFVFTGFSVVDSNPGN